MELHFYPGQNLLIVREGRLIKARFEAWGGPSAMGNDKRMAEEPTWAGQYFIDKAEAYRTNTWPMSRIKWGTELQDQPAKNDVYYKTSGGKWGSIAKDHSINRTSILSTYYQLYGELRVPATWVFNDFGPVSIRWFKDVNGNRKLDGKESLSGQMFHTTPNNEAEMVRKQPLQMVHSHGCIHLKPRDRDQLFVMGAFKKQTAFTVYRYDVIFKP